MADTIQQIQDQQAVLTQLKKDVEMLKQWKSDKEAQQITLPLDRQSTQIISSALGL